MLLTVGTPYGVCRLSRNQLCMISVVNQLRMIQRHTRFLEWLNVLMDEWTNEFADDREAHNASWMTWWMNEWICWWMKKWICWWKHTVPLGGYLCVRKLVAIYCLLAVIIVSQSHGASMGARCASFIFHQLFPSTLCLLADTQIPLRAHISGYLLPLGCYLCVYCLIGVLMGICYQHAEDACSLPPLSTYVCVCVCKCVCVMMP